MSSTDERIEQILEAHRRRLAAISEDQEELESRLEARSAELFQAMAVADAEAAEAEEKARAEAEERERLEAEAREQRDAIARSMAARRGKDVVAPVDEDDEEAQYYQRKSWLV
ncbi:hypothetical protein [Nocardia cyriacigeorgica]|uniref:hypothetical protein n=1 Tax=Nocardia cyriacigeorgica TaxID=135487 RepID=UPI0013D0FF43|nr:hypothetical protein [Nocardia cyriacigeorgica]NEW28656.1 hypothetical protein [Nocardia cyriacigeorgica]